MVALAVVERKRDGKLYPPGGRLPEADRDRAVALVHALRCRDGLSYRQVVSGLADAGLRVSIGSVCAWAHGYTCRWCRDKPPPAPPERRKGLADAACATDSMSITVTVTMTDAAGAEDGLAVADARDLLRAATVAYLARVRERAARYTWQELTLGRFEDRMALLDSITDEEG